MLQILSNQWIYNVILLLNAITAGQIIFFALKFNKAKIGKIILFSLGVMNAIAVGGALKDPGFMLNAKAEPAYFDYDLAPELRVIWLFVNALFGLYVLYSFVKNTKVSDSLFYVAFLVAAYGTFIVFYGIQEFGMRYMPVIIFFTICIYTALGSVIYQIKVATDQRINKRLSYIAAGVFFAIVSLNTFTNYTLIRDTAYTDVSEGWE
ncbi:MAG: hypothetical protein HN613_04035 [Gammaproteobacteria bacterium]|jgi:hypothetical protein|nr:hypothetical protein [Gammaproteobacteria bacterium]MBT7603613.1 hypothetical protein [Gammaproteobacteria bacterium]